VLLTNIVSAQGNADAYSDFSSIGLKESTFNTADCVPSNESNTNSKGENIIEFEPRPFFVYTHPQVRRWMKDKFMMETSANIYQNGENTFLLLHIHINSGNARSSYGDLEKGQKIKLFFSKGDHIYLQNIERNKGAVNRSTDQTLYEGIYLLSKQNLKDLKKRNLNKIGILWEEGYEEYDIQNIDLIKNQISCLN